MNLPKEEANKKIEWTDQRGTQPNPDRENGTRIDRKRNQPERESTARGSQQNENESTEGGTQKNENELSKEGAQKNENELTESASWIDRKKK